MKKLIKLLLLLGGTTALAQPALIPNNTVVIGKTGATDKTIELNLTKSGASTNPKIKWDNTAGKLQFSNDGTNYKSFGSGSGSGGGGINICTENCDFEAGLTPGFVDPDSKATSNSTAPLFDVKDVIFDPSATGQYFRSQAYSIPAGLYGTACLGMIRYTSTETVNANQLQILDGSNALLAGSGNSLPSTSGVPQWGYVAFQCPSSGSLKMQVISTGNASAMHFDNWYFGSDSRLSDLSQATFVGSANIACSGNYSSSTSPGPEDVVASGCTYTKQGVLEDPTISNLAGIRLRNQPPGVYVVYSHFTWNANSAASGRAHIYADVSHESQKIYFNSGTTDHMPTVIVGSFIYGSGIQDIQFKLRTYIDTGTFNISGGGDIHFEVYRYPVGTEQGVRIDQIGWKVDAIMGGNPSLGTATVGSDTGLEDSGLNLANLSGYGTLPAQIPCAGSNPPTGLTCSGNESTGVSFVLPNAGDVVACATFSHQFGLGAATNASATFALVETPNNAQTVTQGGNTRLTHQHDNETAATVAMMVPFRLCDTFSFSGAGQKTLRLFYNQNEASGSIASSNVISPTHFEVYPVNYLSGAMPIFKGMVTSSSEGRVRLESAKVVVGASCSVTSQIGNWITNPNTCITGESTFDYVTPFSSEPDCQVTSNDGNTNKACRYSTSGSSSTQAHLYCVDTATFALVNGSATVTCTGNR